MIDTTDGMKDYIEPLKKTMNEVLNKISELFDGSKIRTEVAVVSFKDHKVKEVIKTLKFTDDRQKAEEFITNLKVDGGGDIPEAVMWGLANSLDNKIGWREDELFPVSKFLILIGDAPPHGSEYYDLADDYKEGCPEGSTLNEIACMIQDMGIIFLMIQVGKKPEITDKMREIF